MSSRNVANQLRLCGAYLEDEQHADHWNNLLDRCFAWIALYQPPFTSPDKQSDAPNTEQCTVAGTGAAGAQAGRTRCARRADCVVSGYIVVERADGINLSAGGGARGRRDKPEKKSQGEDAQGPRRKEK